jgi:RNA recognition motif-containing protein
MNRRKGVTILTNPRTSRPTGTAFVELSSPTDALRAIEQLNGRPIHNRKVSVQQARPNVAGLSPGVLSDAIDNLIDESKWEDKGEIQVNSETPAIHRKRSHRPTPQESDLRSLVPQYEDPIADPRKAMPPRQSLPIQHMNSSQPGNLQFGHLPSRPIYELTADYRNLGSWQPQKRPRPEALDPKYGRLTRPFGTPSEIIVQDIEQKDRRSKRKATESMERGDFKRIPWKR